MLEHALEHAHDMESDTGWEDTIDGFLKTADSASLIQAAMDSHVYSGECLRANISHEFWSQIMNGGSFANARYDLQSLVCYSLGTLRLVT